MANRTLDVELYIGSRDTGVRIARLRAAQPRPVSLFDSLFFFFF